MIGHPTSRDGILSFGVGLLPLDLAATKEYQSLFIVCPHVTAVLMCIPSRSAITGAGRSEANAANAVFLACRAYKPRAANCAAR
jgi:hypothetical protein